MIIKATQKNTRQTPRKVRLVANAVRKLSLTEAIKQLSAIERRASLVVLKVVRQAVANAMHNHGFSFEELKLKNIVVVPAPQFKRFRAVSRGRAHTILKKSCHISVELEAQKGAVITPEKVSEPKTAVKAEAPKAEKKETAKAPKKAVKAEVKSEKTEKKVAKTKKVVKEKKAE